MEDLPDSLLLQIFNYLDFVDVGSVAQTNWRLSRICLDELLWKNLFHRHFGVDAGLFSEPSGSSTWRRDFKRLVDETPMVEVEVLAKHTDQVLHVSFSHDGQLFATSAKDGLIMVWKNGHPVTLEHSRNMKYFSWKYTQYSQFNESDTLLLVSGVLFGHNSTSGEIAILSREDGFQLKCRIMSKPYDIFGSWYSDMYFLSGNHQWLNNLVSRSVIWLNMASQESQSEHAAIMNELYRFYNPKASSVRSLMIANCVDNAEIEISTNRQTSVEGTSNRNLSENSSNRDNHTGNPLSNLPLEQAELSNNSGPNLMRINSKGHQGTLQGAFQNWRPLDNVANIKYSEAYRNQKVGSKLESDAGASGGNCKAGDEEGPSLSQSTSLENLFHEVDVGNAEEGSEASSPDYETSQREDSVEEDDILDTRDKWLIFTCSSETYTPHRIGFKRIKPMYFKGKLDPGPPIKERMEEYNRRRQEELEGRVEPEINWADYSAVADKFDTIDHIVDLHGHIIGMALSPDHRYLYVNSRPWPEGYKISNPLEPPPIASEIDIHVIDLKTITQVGMMRRAHRAYTPNEECFFIFLDACDEFVASGAEDKHGYVWDRHYGISLVKLPHTDVVNSVAFNPQNSQMLVSVSDDISIKIWRSKEECRNLGLSTSMLKKGTTLYNLRRHRVVSNSSTSFL